MNPAASLAAKSYFNFALSQVAGFLANTGTVWCLVELGHVPAWAAKVAAIAVSFAVNFSLSHFLVFRTRDPQRRTLSWSGHATRQQSDRATGRVSSPISNAP